MKNYLKLLFVILISITTIFVSCNKDENKTNVTTNSSAVLTTISGIVFNTNHQPLSDVEVSVGDIVQLTGSDGAFLFEDVPVSNDRFKVDFNKDGYFETFRAGKAISNGVTKVEINMVSISTSEATTYSMNFNSSTGGVLFGSTDTILYFPPNLYYKREDGSYYVGNIDVYAKYVDATLPEYSQIVPGDDLFGRIGATDYYLNSYSGIMVALFDNNGDKLNLSSNNTQSAQIHVKIPTSILTNAPDSIDLWHNGGDLAYATNNGGRGRKRNGKYVSAVGHFSLWSMQEKSTGYGTITGRVSDCNGEPINGVRVQVGQSYAITNNDGVYSRVMPAGVDNIAVQVLAEDYFGNASAPITENALIDGENRADVDISLPCVGTITGNLVNCFGEQVPGQVVVTDGMNNISKTYTENGYFELKFDQNITSYTINCKGYNYSESINVSGATYPYNAGDITLCPPVLPPAGSNIVTVDGTTSTNFTSADGYFYGTSLSLYAQGQMDYFSLELENCTGVGTWPIHYGYVYITETNFDISTGSATITRFDDVGGRIIGTFTATGTGGESISGAFNMQRSQDQ